MKKTYIPMEESLKDLPVAARITRQLNDCPSGLRKSLLDRKSDEEFIADRVKLFLLELDKALAAGHDPISAERVALEACTKDLR